MTATPEFSRLIAIEGISPDKTRHETITASEEECAALAQRFGLRELFDFTAKIAIRRVAGGKAIRVAGSFSAEVVQICVVSLRDVPDFIEGSFETFFSEEPVEPGDEDAPEMISKGHIDLGEVVAQYLSLELNPYPRAPGVSLAAQLAEAGVGEGKASPFMALKALSGGSDGKTDDGEGGPKRNRKKKA